MSKKFNIISDLPIGGGSAQDRADAKRILRAVAFGLRYGSKSILLGDMTVTHMPPPIPPDFNNLRGNS
jgi:hypothetical protein